MQFVPWRYISEWKCISCGKCCIKYSVVLNLSEWLKIVHLYGAEKTVSGLDKIFITRRTDGSCAFLYRVMDMNLCGLQHIKPKACKLWPFKVLEEPKYGHAGEAFYNYGKNGLYVYADSNCLGLAYGEPKQSYAHSVIREFVEIAIEHRISQIATTRKVAFAQPYTLLRPGNITLRSDHFYV